MIGVVLRRVGVSVLVLIGLVALVFVLQRQSGIDALAAKYQDRVSAETLAAERAELGLDQPLPVQFAHYFGAVARGDFGQSLVTNRPVAQDLGAALPATFELAAVALLMAVVLAGLLGVGMAHPWRGRGSLRSVLLIGGAIPSFLLGIVLLLVFYRWLQILPASGRISRGLEPPRTSGWLVIDSLLAGQPLSAWDAVQHLLAPALCIAVVAAVVLGRTLGGELETFRSSDAARTVRSTGRSELSLLLVHGIRNSAGALFAVAGLQIVALLGGTVIVEQIFGWPGVGQYLVRAVAGSDLNAIAAVTLALGVTAVTVTTVLDLLSVWADPRTRLR